MEALIKVPKENYSNFQKWYCENFSSFARALFLDHFPRTDSDNRFCLEADKTLQFAKSKHKRKVERLCFTTFWKLYTFGVKVFHVIHARVTFHLAFHQTNGSACDELSKVLSRFSSSLVDAMKKLFLDLDNPFTLNVWAKLFVHPSAVSLRTCSLSWRE